MRKLITSCAVLLALLTAALAATFSQIPTLSGNPSPSDFIVGVTGSNTTDSRITFTQATQALSQFSTSLQGVVPGSGGGTVNFLRADGTWIPPRPTLVGTNDIVGLSAPVSGTLFTPAVSGVYEICSEIIITATDSGGPVLTVQYTFADESGTENVNQLNATFTSIGLSQPSCGAAYMLANTPVTAGTTLLSGTLTSGRYSLHLRTLFLG